MPRREFLRSPHGPERSARPIRCLHEPRCSRFLHWRKVLLQSNVDRHHILPRAQFPENLRPTADNIANVAFIAGDVNKSIGQAGPEVYLAKVKTRVLESQCIPTDSPVEDRPG